MAKLVPDAEATAANLARILRPRAASSGDAARTRAVAARRLLEELGVRCDENAALHDLKGFLISSAHGTEIVVSRDLSDEERLGVYAHLVAHALLGPDHPDLALVTRFEYAPGYAPGYRPAWELEEEKVVEGVAKAILAGRLEATPRLVYCRDLGPGRGRLSRAVLRGLHRGSLAFYRRSRSYQRIRSLPAFAAITERVHSFLGSAA